LLKKTGNLAVIKEIKPDVVILATGAVEMKLKCLQGECQENIMTCWQALTYPEKIGNRVVIIGGGSTGCETAEFLSGQKIELDLEGMIGQGPEIKYKVKNKTSFGTERDVSIIEMMDDVAIDQSEHNRELLLLRLKESGVKIQKRAKVQKIDGNRLTYLDVNELELKDIEADTFVVSVGVASRKELFAEIKKADVRCIQIGDCVKVGKISDAIYQGALAATQI
jgi:pyruvate/2-oxoglutarate dehydrogenase complex dihydrolipoamide dehydrogenase (E3) component